MRGVSERTLQRRWEKARIYLRSSSGTRRRRELRREGRALARPRALISTALLDLSGFRARRLSSTRLRAQDPELAADLERLLASHDDVARESFLEEAPRPAPRPHRSPGRHSAHTR